MPRKLAIIGFLAALLCGCQTAPVGYWYKGTVRVDANPALFEAFSRDRTICDGEAAKAALSSAEKNLAIHNRNVNLIFDACLTERGYTRR